jgi:phage shock protein PspC (stress-responsive transcriptional regulator)
MTAHYFSDISEYLGIISWFVVLISAKLSHVSARKKLTRSQVIANIVYGIVGGIMAYFGTMSFKDNIRIIATGVGVLGGDIMVSYIIDNTKPIMESVGRTVLRFIKKK